MSARHRFARFSRSPLLIAVILAAVATASAGGFAWVHVHRGDTLAQIAKKRHTTVSELVALNHLPGNGDLIIAGTRLKVPRHHDSHHGTHHHGAGHRADHHRGRHHHAAHQAVHRVVGHYTVRSGDSLDAIAARWHVPPQRIARANRLPSSLIVRIGQVLRIPHWAHGPRHHARPAHHARRAHHRRHHRAHHRHHAHRAHHHRAHHHHRRRNAVPSQIAARAAKDRAWLARRHVPSREGVARMIRRTAVSFHVPVNFALAVSWQESGFNQRAVSPVGAIGAMQVVPSSGRFVSSYVVHRRLHLLNAHDNVVAGVGLLSLLLADTHGNQRLAAAGYYQGLASVRANGFYSDTKRYVADVLALRSRFG